MSTPTLERRKIVYPDSDGQPMAENTLHFEWIVRFKEGAETLFRDDPNVFVAGDLLWYPVEGNNELRAAPDGMVVFGRPKGTRGSYLQWEENDVAPQVVMEFQSPGNRFGQMLRKFHFYEEYGVEEYYLYDPFQNTLEGWVRKGSRLVPIEVMKGWVSPRMGIRFAWDDDGLTLLRPDGLPLESYQEVVRRAEAERERALEEHRRAQAADRRAEDEHRRAQAADERAERLAAQLRALGVEPANGSDA